ncbi:MAG: LytTR family DNA-binding domain-containing protein, partial [Flavobacteriales bacterium]|nr:LytTR family DNA-binding domain-containing protein [Flavobacteriales bacterium]
DINLKDGLSIKYLSQFDDITFKVIFITAHDNYAVDAFRLSATDYLLKPIDPEEFQQAIQKIRMQKALKVDVLNQMYSDESNVENHKIVLNTQSDIFVLPVKELMYLKAEGSYTTFYFLDQKIVVSKNLKEYEGPLLKRGFFRSHHSYLVNLSFARKFNKDHSTIDLGKNIFIPVSSRKKDALLNAMRLS